MYQFKCQTNFSLINGIDYFRCKWEIYIKAYKIHRSLDSSIWEINKGDWIWKHQTSVFWRQFFWKFRELCLIRFHKVTVNEESLSWS
jgi:hypothetical protein